jgi:hypothetical protein
MHKIKTREEEGGRKQKGRREGRRREGGGRNGAHQEEELFRNPKRNKGFEVRLFCTGTGSKKHVRIDKKKLPFFFPRVSSFFSFF